TSDAQLRIGESPDSGSAPSGASRNDGVEFETWSDARRDGAFRQLNIPGETQQHQQSQQQIGQIDLPPVPLVAGATGFSMMIIMPSFTAGDDGYPNIVAAVVAGVVILVAEHMRKRIYGPADMPDHDGSDHDPPEPDAGAELNRFNGRTAERQLDQKPARIKQNRRGRRDPHT